MKCLKNASKGSSTVEFVLILPWLIAFFLSILAVAIWVLLAQFSQYEAYQASRGVGVYQQKNAKIGIADAPVHFALEGEMADLSAQGSPIPEFRKIPLMDNPIGFCGSQGDYGLCER